MIKGKSDEPSTLESVESLALNTIHKTATFTPSNLNRLKREGL